MSSAPPAPARPCVIIIGGGFGGMAAARALRRAPVDITLIDRRNHHVFQPLLYQVATASLSPADVAWPIRHVLRRQRNASVLLAEVTGIDLERKTLRAGDALLRFDYLVVASGASHAYFGHEHWAEHAPGLKTIEDALEIRRRFLLAFETAEAVRDQRERRRELTFVVVGAGPTGVELAGAMIEIARHAIPRDFRNIDTGAARVVLIEAQSRVLPGFPQACSARAKRDLERAGVEVRLNQRVTGVDARGVDVEATRIDSASVFWAAGVSASPLGAMLHAPLDAAGRVLVDEDLSLPGRSDVFVIGDLARVVDRGREVPGMAPGAMQMGRHVGRLIRESVRGPAPAQGHRPFRYRDKGLLATIGRGRAVAYLWGRAFGGLPAWLIWAALHIYFLIGVRLRVLVMLQWAWEYVTWHRGARLITGNAQPSARPGESAPRPDPATRAQPSARPGESAPRPDPSARAQASG